MLLRKIMHIVFVVSLFGLTTFVGAQDVDSSSVSSSEAARYQLGSGDEIRVIVYGEEDLSGEFVLDGTGIVAMPLIGPVILGGKDLSHAERLITKKLAEGYLVNPRVSIEVLNYRPFYILGEVKKPGSYPYVSGMTVLNAVALASGFTYRANEKKIEATRRDADGEVKVRVDITSPVLPGDIIRVPERFF